MAINDSISIEMKHIGFWKRTNLLFEVDRF